MAKISIPLTYIYTKCMCFGWVLKNIIKLISTLCRNRLPIRIVSRSLAEYEAVGDSEQITHEKAVGRVLFKNNLHRMNWKEVKYHYLKDLYTYIDVVLQEKESINILEVGCGNCINIVNIVERYGAKVSITGIDISPKRIEVAKDYYGSALEGGVNLRIASATNKLPFEDNEFDIVFSMHCLEQITYEIRLALQEMYRAAGKFLIMIEPVFENGNLLQKLYLIRRDYCRALLATVKDLKLPIIENRSLDIQSNPCNQSSIIAVAKQSDSI